jgi:Flp pilus assembly secretin CpaC
MSRYWPVLAVVTGLMLAGVAPAQEKEANKPEAPPAPLALIAYELTIVHLTPSSDDKVDDESQVDLPVMLKEWQEQGRVKWMKTMRLSACDNQSAHVQFGEQRAIATGSTAGPRGRNTSYQFQEVGLVFRATGRVEQDQSILAEIDVSHSDIEARDESATAGEQAVELPPPTTFRNQVQTTVRLRDGKAIVLGGVAEDSADDKSKTLVFLSASIAE